MGYTAERFDAVVPDTGEVVEFEGRQLVLPGRVTTIGLQLPDGLSFESWRGVGSALQGVDRSLMWWIGDWYRYGEERFGEDASDAVEEFGYSPETVRKAVFVANRIDVGGRRPNLSWEHHKAAAGLGDRSERSEVLDKAEREGWTSRDLRAEVRRRKGLPDRAERPAPEPPPAPLEGPDRDLALRLSHWLIEGRRMIATFKSGQVAALRCKENGVAVDPDRVDAVMEFLSVLYHALTAEEPAERAA